MPTYLPCKKNGTNGYVFYVGLVSQANTKIMQANPTLAAGDVKIAIDDGAPANLGTLPAVDADFTKRLKVTLSQAETNGDNLTIIFSDAAGAEWCDLTINIPTVARQLDDHAYPTTSGRSIDVDATGGVEITPNQAVNAAQWAGVATATDDVAIVTAPTNFALLSIDGSGYVTEVNVDGIKKNTVLSNFEFLMVDATDGYTEETGLSVTAQRSIDGAAFGACANAVTEVSNGIYKINLAAADLNGDVITLRFSATGARTRLITIKTNT